VVLIELGPSYGSQEDHKGATLVPALLVDGEPAGRGTSRTEINVYFWEPSWSAAEGKKAEGFEREYHLPTTEVCISTTAEDKGKGKGKASKGKGKDEAKGIAGQPQSWLECDDTACTKRHVEKVQLMRVVSRPFKWEAEPMASSSSSSSSAAASSSAASQRLAFVLDPAGLQKAKQAGDKRKWPSSALF
jgi:hypothetical protein